MAVSNTGKPEVQVNQAKKEQDRSCIAIEMTRIRGYCSSASRTVSRALLHDARGSCCPSELAKNLVHSKLPEEGLGSFLP